MIKYKIKGEMYNAKFQANADEHRGGGAVAIKSAPKNKKHTRQYASVYQDHEARRCNLRLFRTGPCKNPVVLASSSPFTMADIHAFLKFEWLLEMRQEKNNATYCRREPLALLWRYRSLHTRD